MQHSQPSKLTKAHMEKGIDENGSRIKLFTSALTSERAVQAGVGSFRYEGGTTTGRHQRLHTNNIANDQARHGYGECVYDSGATYKGEWVNDRRQGKGVFTYGCGDQYDGEWHEGKYHGKGTYSSKSGGDEYEGEWQADRCEGRGVYKYVESGDNYTGQVWTHGRPLDLLPSPSPSRLALKPPISLLCRAVCLRLA